MAVRVGDRGWTVWVMSRLGVMLNVFVFFVLLFTIYSIITCVDVSDGANVLGTDLSSVVLLVYAGGDGFGSVYHLPDKINNIPYSLEYVNCSKTSCNRGFYLNMTCRCGPAHGASPVAISIDAGVLKNMSETNITLVLRNVNGVVTIGKKNRCSGCIALDFLNCDAGGPSVDDRDMLNDEFVVFRNDCGFSCNLSGWFVRDSVRSRPPYRFPEFVLGAGNKVTLHTGNGVDNPSDVFWNNQDVSPNPAIWENDADTLYLSDENDYLSLTYSYSGGACHA